MLMLAGTVSAVHAADVRVGVTISGEVVPGVYGRVQIGDVPPPLVYAQPVVVVHEAHRRPLEPIYLHVPPGHARQWSKFCGRYNACSRPVYFVRSAEYEPGYVAERGRRDDRHDNRRDRDGDHDDDHGRGKDHGRGHDRDD
jgi:hypothetical protein